MAKARVGRLSQQESCRCPEPLRLLGCPPGEGRRGTALEGVLGGMWRVPSARPRGCSSLSSSWVPDRISFLVGEEWDGGKEGLRLNESGFLPLLGG